MFLVATLAAGSSICGGVERAGADPSAGDAAEIRVAASLRSWFSLLARQAPEPGAIERFLLESPFEFPLTEAGNPDPDGLRAWVSDLRSEHPQVEYQIDTIRTDSIAGGLVRAQFEIDRRAVDEEGALHVTRGGQTWLIRDLPFGNSAVLRIDEQRLLSFPGTGPQIVCY